SDVCSSDLKTNQVGAERLPAAREIETRQRVQVAIVFGVERRNTVYEWLEYSTELAFWFGGAFSDDRLKSVVTCNQPEDFTGIAVFEGLQDDGVAGDNGH